MVVYFAGLRAIPQEFFEQAALDGARKTQILFKIALPLLTPSILFNVIMAVIGVFRLFRESYLLQGAYPDTSVYMLQNFMNNNFYALNYNRLAAASVLFFILLGAGLVLMLRFLRHRNAL
jgi:multiple sugar transport system permease protein